jgi:hypothetical protein
MRRSTMRQCVTAGCQQPYGSAPEFGVVQWRGRVNSRQNLQNLIVPPGARSRCHVTLCVTVVRGRSLFSQIP